MQRLVIIIGLVAALTAWSVSPGLALAKRSFAAMDKDHDGWISFEEVFVTYPGVDEEYFETFDKNRDGVLDANEWKRFVPRSR
ncbi:EF-hand domain-containing protein [Desulfocurvibacter africanus]|uniref:EF-hand domain-containing protein n=1 Tax=Desulfocurvibacter africanus TaxID=873 RepID=UPI002FDAA6DE